MSVAHRAFVVDNAVVTANWVAVYGMVHRAVANSTFFHIANHLFKGIQILGGVSIHFNVRDMACIRQSVIWCFYFYLLKCRNRIIYWNMEAVGIVILSLIHICSPDILRKWPLPHRQ